MSRIPAQRVVAVTGACTFLGGELLRRLEEDPRYAKVLALDIRPPALAPGSKVEFVKVDLTQPTGIQYAILGGTMIACDIGVMIGYTGLASTVLRLLKDPGHIRWTNRGLGGLFVVAGGMLAVFKR